MSELELPELAPARPGEGGDLAIHLNPAPQMGVLVDDEPTLALLDNGDVDLAFAGVGRFTVAADGRRITVSAPPAMQALARLPLLGPVMGTALHLRGALVLHASAVAQDHCAVAFLGDKGAGKSTTAAALIAQGAQLVTDDLLVCSLEEEAFARCEPAFAQVKLVDDAAQVLALPQAERLASPHPAFTKQQQRLQGLAAERLPLGAIGVLGRGDQLAVERLNEAEALQALLQFSYILRFSDPMLGGARFIAHFQRCAALARRVPVFSVTAPSSLSGLQSAVGTLAKLMVQSFVAP